MFLTLSKNGKPLGDIVFRLYDTHVPQTANNFMSLITGHNIFKACYKGSTFTKGYPGIVMQGGRVTNDNLAASGTRMLDENLTMRHTKKGQLTMYNTGQNSNGSEFMITLGDTAKVLDGYHQVFGEMVSGEEVLKNVEEAVTRLGTLKEVIKIEDCGS